ncbi:hypothetical protein BJ508DRAFT_301062 [Ascobolus immersus RN42]|uniref:Uncharacterized protein n=1 Tax=Ascobolus immersus RN42 TaxID=1160509 RepID=A0A3N4IPH5_ASCIM|nr:hypothetical protein BJ508DRAFT_301062 [Ascobolus immersus RN42]
MFTSLQSWPLQFLRLLLLADVGYVGLFTGVSAMHWQHPMCTTNDFSPLLSDCMHAFNDIEHINNAQNGIQKAWPYRPAFCSRHFNHHGFWTWVIHGTCRIDVYDAAGWAPCVYHRSLREAVESIFNMCAVGDRIEGRKELPFGKEGFFREVRVTYNQWGLDEPTRRWNPTRWSNGDFT